MPVLRGTVLDEARAALVGYTVKGESETITGSKTLLFQATTDANGFTKTYAEPQGSCVRLVVTVLDTNTFEVASRTVISPADDQVVDFVIGGSEGAAPLYADITTKLAAALGETSVGTLDETGVARASLCAGVEPLHAGLAREADAADALSGVPGAAFFALGMAEMPPRVADVVKHSSAERRRAFNAAVSAGVLTQAQVTAATAGLLQLDELELDSALQIPNSIASPGLAFSLAGIATGDQRPALEAWRAHQGDTASYWTNAWIPRESAAGDVSAWTKVGTPGEVSGLADPDGGAGGVTTSDDDVASREGHVLNGSYAIEASTRYRATFAVLKDADVSRFPEVRIARSTDEVQVSIGTQSGDMSVRSVVGFTNVAVSSETHPLSSKWWLFHIEFDSNLTGAPKWSVFPAHASAFGGSDDTATGAMTWYPGGCSLAESFSLGEADQGKLQYALQLSALTRGHVPLIQALHPQFTALAGLAAFERWNWDSAVATSGVPAHLTSAGLDGDYAAAMFTAIEDAFPTPMLSARNAWFSPGVALTNFIGGNPDYDLAGMSFREFTRQNPGALAAAGTQQQQDDVAAELPILERLYRISPRGQRFEVMQNLRTAGLTSATQIASMGRTQFISLMSSALSTTVSEQVFRSARSLSAAALTLQMRHRATAPFSGMAVLPVLQEGRPDVGSDTIGWEELFAGRSYCNCEHCQSAHGPAAYLADLLFWLNGRTTGGNHWDVLKARRPDVETLQLSCKNANTPLPTIDLINELLEDAVQGPVTVRQTTWDEAELAARPEHSNAGAYAKLAEPVPYPFEQPYLLDLDKTRTFLAAFGLERAALQAAFATGGIEAALARPETAAEILGTTRTTWAVLTGELSATTADEWGVGAAAPTTTEEIAPVEMFLRQAGVRSAEDPMTYAELEDLVRSGYVQQPGQLGISFTNTVCDIAGASLQSESLDAHLDRIAKLLRLSRTLGWSVADTDRAIEIFRESAGPGLPVESDISESLLLSLAAIAWLRRSINLGPSAILDWWGPLDTRRWAERLEDVSGPGMGRVPTSNLDSANAGGPDAEPSPFQKMVGKLDSAGIFALSNDGTELADTNNSISDYLDAVASVVGARPSALTPLVEDLGTDPKITLANLSHLRRHVQFARVLGMRTEDLLKWKTWTGIDPFASPLDAVRFASEVERQASVRLDDDAFEELIGSPGTRDLSTMTLPSVGEAMLALADEYRAGTAAGAQANGAQYLFDYNNATFTRASEASFADPRSRWAFAGTGEAVRATLPTLGSWTPTNAPSSAGGQPDPEGGHDAELSEDNSASHEWYQVSTSYALVSGAHYELRLAIKKDSDQTRFPEIQIVRGADFIHCQVNTETGASAIRAQLGFTATSFVVTTHPHDADWWLCTVGLTANAAGPLTARMLIAGGSTFGVANASATGTVTWYPKATLVETNGAAWRLSNEARIFADGSVLIEGSRTNLVGSGTGSGASEEWGGQWVATATRAANTDGDPDGGTDADQITLSAASGASNGGLAYADQAISQTIGIPYTLSGYFKSISGDGKLVIRSYPPGDADDLNLSASWERHSSTTTPTSATASGLGYGNYGWAGGAPYPGAKVIASWGLQYERGAFASSPIRTTTAAGARSPDLCRFTVDAVLAAALESEAGFTFDWWPAFSSVDARDDTNARLFDIGANHVSLYFSGTTDLTLNLYSGAADIATVTVPPWSAGDRLRVHVKIPSADTWELRVENVTTASGAVSATGSGPSISTETKVLTIGNFNTGTFYCPGVYSQMWTGDGTPPALHPERDRLIIRRAAALLSVDESLLDGLLELPFAGQAVRETIIADAGLVDGARALDPEATASIESIEALVDNQVWELVAIPSWLCRVFGLGVDDLQWLVDASGAIRGFDLQDVVLQPAIGDRYAAWSALREAARMQSVAVDGRLFDLFGDLVTGAVASASELRSELVTRTRWSAENLAAAIDDSFGGPIGGGSASAWAEPERFARLATWMELASETGADAAQMAGWGTLVWQSPGTAEPLSDYAASAAELEQALRGVWGDERWLEQMPAVREPIRQRSRSALVSRLVGDPGYAYTSSADVAESLLVDVQMGGCARTSRLKDATRTVQSFVQRVQLGREGALQLTDAESREWLWRKNYRVWEANRKIFLWPENWIQPELRRDKTPLFEQLEVALAQGDLGEEQVEGAFREYLRGLSAVAKLQTVAILREERAVGEDVYHVFARSRDVPPTYYHRSWLDGRRWTPWEKVVDAEGDHLVPVVYQRRVILFWLNISETAIQPSSSPVPDVNGSAPAPERYFKFHLSWSELRDGEWSSPRRSQAYIGLDERGGQQPDRLDLTGLEATRVFRDSSVSSRRFTVPRSVIYAGAQVDQNGRDLLIQLYRDGSSPFTERPQSAELFDNYTIALPRFRFSAVDGNITSENISPGDVIVNHGPLPTAQGRVYVGDSQRYVGSDDLVLPIAYPGSDTVGPMSQTVVRAYPAPVPRTIRITPTHRPWFNPREPFVFEDEEGAYWVTLDTVFQLADAGFDLGLNVRDPLALPPEQRQRQAPRIEMFAETPPAFRNQSNVGSFFFVPNSSLTAAIAGGTKLADVHGSTVDRTASTYALRTQFTFLNAIGATIGVAVSGSSPSPDLQAELGVTMQLPPIVSQPSVITEGPQSVRPLIAKFRFQSFAHPHLGTMRELLNRLGILGLLDPPSGEPLEGQKGTADVRLQDRYVPLGVSQPYPQDDLDFEIDGAYAQYNWELFFHVPFLIAARKHEAGQYADALKWLHPIFDPTRPTAEDESRPFWRFRPFREEFENGSTAPKNIQQTMALLTADASDPGAVDEAERLLEQIADWRRNPFDPHAIARTRLTAYMTAVVMRYLEVLLDWGDQLFAQDTMESVAEASELYMLAARILGPRPEGIDVSETPPSTFGDLLTNFQNGIGPIQLGEEVVEAWEIADDEFPDDADSLASMLYFCTPANPQLKSRFWDRTADRLFKVRNCLDIEGRRRDLPLFAPPIDPALLVRAAASGVDLQTLLSDVSSATVPHRRYLAMAELAAGLAASARSLGEGLMSAIQARDGDQLAALRAEHERVLHTDTIRARTDAIEEARAQLDALETGLAAAQARQAFYEERIEEGLNPHEERQIHLNAAANAATNNADIFSSIGAVLGLIPQFDLGTAGAGGSPVAKAGFGGVQLSAAFNLTAKASASAAGRYDREGRMLLTQAGYDRRLQTWEHQRDLAMKDVEAAQRHIAAANIRLAIAENALETANTRKDQLDEIQTVLEKRFGREELFDWMAGQLAGLHFQSYQLAYEFSKKAQAAWNYELGRTDGDFIRFGYWDSRRKGLLAADRLGHDLRRMQVAYIEENKRRLEVDQTFSLREIDPAALVRLQETGTTAGASASTFTLPEAFFDLYYPGQYKRRIRAVRVTIPAIVPPNANLPAMLTLSGHRIRATADLAAVMTDYGDPPVKMTATSSGQRDGGVFELDFRAPRLLPFEGAGAISDWVLTLPAAVRPFDYRQIQDVLIHVAYDADYSETLRTSLETGSDPAVRTHLFATSPPRRRVISLRNEHGSAFRQLVQAPATTDVAFEITDASLPAYMRPLSVEVANPFLVLRGAGDTTNTDIVLNTQSHTTFAQWNEVDGAFPMPAADASLSITGQLPGTYTIQAANWGNVDPNADGFDIFLVVDLSEGP